MPICDEPLPVGDMSAQAVDDHGSESAKVKRTRDQAYYNSYDFDAIEELPSDDDAITASGTADNRNSRTLPISEACSSHRWRCRPNAAPPEQSKRNDVVPSVRNEHHNSVRYAAYLQRFGSFLASPPPATDLPYHQHNPIHLDEPQKGVAVMQMPAAQATDDRSSFAPPNAKRTPEPTHGRNFLLPRAILKYQSISLSNSMSPAGNTTAHGAGSGKLIQAVSNGSIRASSRSSTRSTVSATADAFLPSSCKMRPRYDGHTGFLTMMEISTTIAPAKLTAAVPQPAPPLPLVPAPPPLPLLLPTQPPSTVGGVKTYRDSIGSERGDRSLVVADKDVTSCAVAASQKSRTTLECESSAVVSHGAAGAYSGRRGPTASHQSHYSTDKSGSSGYYSSNVCSTYSLEDHIYCEPIVDVLDLNSKSKSVVGGKVTDSTTLATFAKRHKQQQMMQLQLQQKQKQETPQPTLNQTTTVSVNGSSTSEKHGEAESVSKTRIMNDRAQTRRHVGTRNGFGIDDDDDAEEAEEDDEDQRKSKQRRTTEKVESLLISRNLRILETSIENLDRHLKNHPNVGPQEEAVSYMQSHHSLPPQIDAAEKSRVHRHLPTIMEGYVPANEPGPWPDDIADDSLLDIDLDSFLLVNERRDVRSGKHIRSEKSSGIDNPTFLTDELEENNYKCAKYINSCPEDAYRVESDIIAGCSAPLSEKSASVDHILKRYEDQLHFQNTRELLEDVRDKIRLLSHSSNALRSSSSESRRSGDATASNEDIPKELQGMIETLKQELESYLERMNQHSELEIRQLCSGLVKSQHIMKIKKAFDRRYSTTSLGALETDNDFATYEAIHEGVPLSIRKNIASIRCASDPNFKMKRRSLAEAFPVTNCYIKSIVGNCAAQSDVASTQIQRNLSFQSPILRQFDPHIGPHSDTMSANALRASSGTESGGDKESTILEWHRKKPSIWEMYYGTNRMSQSLLGKRIHLAASCSQETMSYPSSRPESDFTLDLPRAEQLRIKMEKEKKFRQRCRYITTFLSLVFFLLTVMVVSLVLTRGKRMFGSMI